MPNAETLDQPAVFKKRKPYGKARTNEGHSNGFNGKRFDSSVPR